MQEALRPEASGQPPGGGKRDAGLLGRPGGPFRKMLLPYFFVSRRSSLACITFRLASFSENENFASVTSLDLSQNGFGYLFSRADVNAAADHARIYAGLTASMPPGK